MSEDPKEDRPLPEAKEAVGEPKDPEVGVEEALIIAAVDQVVVGAPKTEDDYCSCPYCSYVAPFKNERGDGSLKKHLRETHPLRIVQFALHPELGTDAYNVLLERKRLEDMELALPEGAGIDVTDELDDWDFLEVPAFLKGAVESTGAGLRWASQDRIGQYVQRGFQVLSRTQLEEAAKAAGETAGFAHNHNHEDDSLRANEMVLLYIPPDIKAKRDTLRKARAEQQSNGLVNRGEQSEAFIDVLGERIYNDLKAKYPKMPDSNAYKISQRLLKKFEDKRPDEAEAFREGIQTTISTGPISA